MNYDRINIYSKDIIHMCAIEPESEELFWDKKECSYCYSFWLPPLTLKPIYDKIKWIEDNKTFSIALIKRLFIQTSEKYLIDILNYLKTLDNFEEIRITLIY